MNLILTLCVAIALANVAAGNGEMTQVVPALGTLCTQETYYNSTPNSPLDAPHVIGISPCVFEWWWFDAESTDLSSSIVVVFFTTSAAAFPLVAGMPSTSIIVNAKLPNGTTIISEAPALGGACINYGGRYGNGAQGVWNDLLGCQQGNFTVSSDLSTAEIFINLVGVPTPISGSIKFTSIAPAHYPCTTNLNDGNNLLIAPHVGWSNAMPAANVSGTFEIFGETFTVNGKGYHDKNWGDQPFLLSISSWYWGHATFGPWTVVFFNGTTASNSPFADAYVAYNGTILVSSCVTGSALVDPCLNVLGLLENLTLTIPLPSGNTLQVNFVATSINIWYPLVYARYLITATGGQVGQEQYSGIGTLEHFSLPSTDLPSILSYLCPFSSVCPNWLNKCCL